MSDICQRQRLWSSEYECSSAREFAAASSVQHVLHRDYETVLLAHKRDHQRAEAALTALTASSTTR